MKALNSQEHITNWNRNSGIDRQILRGLPKVLSWSSKSVQVIWQSFQCSRPGYVCCSHWTLLFIYSIKFLLLFGCQSTVAVFLFLLFQMSFAMDLFTRPICNRVRKLRMREAVLCEKPLCVNVHETKELLAYAKRKNLFFMEALRVHFFPAYQKLGELLNSNAIGEITNVFVSL